MKKINRNIEEVSLNAFPAEFVDLYDGWVIRKTPNYPSRRINSVNILTRPSEETLPYKIEHCEAFFKARYSEIAFKMSNLEMHASTDVLLASKGYSKVTPTNVMTLNLNTCVHQNSRSKKVDSRTVDFENGDFQFETLSICLDQSLSLQWLESYTKFKHLGEKEYSALQTCLEKIANPVYYLSIQDKDRWVGAGQAVIEEGYVGLFDIAVHEAYRCRGIGRKILEVLIGKAKENGAEIAYLQVVADNEPAKKLYQSLGFQDLYQYWYRVKSF